MGWWGGDEACGTGFEQGIRRSECRGRGQGTQWVEGGLSGGMYSCGVVHANICRCGKGCMAAGTMGPRQ